jgi:hypothetical protein
MSLKEAGSVTTKKYHCLLTFDPNGTMNLEKNFPMVLESQTSIAYRRDIVQSMRIGFKIICSFVGMEYGP